MPKTGSPCPLSKSSIAGHMPDLVYDPCAPVVKQQHDCRLSPIGGTSRGRREEDQQRIRFVLPGGAGVKLIYLFTQNLIFMFTCLLELFMLSHISLFEGCDMENKKVPVSERAFTQRINRVLAKEGKKLFKSRSWGEKSNLGEWHVVDTYTNTVFDSHLKLEEYGRGCGAMKPYECLSEE